MRNPLFLVLCLTLYNCSFGPNNNNVYWCGDHPCINKSERQAYFKKNMVVEVKKIDKRNIKNSELEKIMDQAKKDEQKRIRKDKTLTKKIKKDEKYRLKEEKKLAKKMRLDEERRLKEEKKLKKEENKIVKKEVKINASSNSNNIINLDKLPDSFELLKKKVYLKNSLRKYPDINQGFE